MTIFKAGDYCFNEHGEQAQYVAQAGGGHVVRYMYERGDEEERRGPQVGSHDPPSRRPPLS